VNKIDDRKIAEIQQSLENQFINAPLMEDEEIKEASSVVARDLLFKTDNTARIEFQENTYTFKFKSVVKDFKEFILMFVINEETKAMADKANQPYRPYMLSVEVTNSMDKIENLRAVVETFFRHITGSVRPEVLD